MAPKLRKTTADYLAIAVSPALVMMLVGSLVFFLIEVIYAGDYQARITYVFAWLVFATVLIARISIEMGSERAAMYSVPLALAVFVVLQAFATYNTPLSPLINIGLIGLVWWCAHRLTWDCTFIEDDEDASGEGLLDRVGSDEEKVPPPRKRANELDKDETPAPLWKRLLVGEGGPHTPGVWVLYFSLAALPLFGIGQRFIPADDASARRYGFLLLVIYVAAGLSLLVTTSFLGFRRYLRQRQVEMPSPMAITWVATGGVLIAVIMLLAMLLPRPAAEYTVAKLPWEMTSPGDLDPSRYGMGPDGVEREEATRTRASDDPEAPTVDSPDGEHAGGKSEGEQGAPQAGEQGDAQGENANNQSNSKGDSQEDSEGQEGTPNESPPQGESQSESSGSEPSGTEGDENDPPDAEGAERGGEGGDEATERNWQMSHDEPARSPQQVLQQASRWVGGLIGLVKWLFFLLILAVVLYFAWKYRRELMAALRELIRDFRAWLARLMGGKPVAAKVAPEAAPPVKRPPRRFHHYRNPFEQGSGAQKNPAELVVYTFEALEAWASDRGEPRLAEQTPQEFIGSVIDPAAPEARWLAVLYNRLAYGEGGITSQEADELKGVWRIMQSAAPRMVAAE